MSRELNQLSQKHFAMVEAALAGNSNRDIAAAFGLTESSVSLILRSPLFQDELARRRATQQRATDQLTASTLNESKRALEASALKAANVHIDLLESCDAKVRQTSATEILKRTHDNKFLIGQNGMPTVNINLGPDALLNLQIALKESFEIEGKVSPELVEQQKEPQKVAESPSAV